MTDNFIPAEVGSLYAHLPPLPEPIEEGYCVEYVRDGRRRRSGFTANADEAFVAMQALLTCWGVSDVTLCKYPPPRNEYTQVVTPPEKTP